MERKAFLDQEAPAGYVAGIGRGATGFTTSADVGSASRIVPGEDEDIDENNSEYDGGELGILGKSKGNSNEEDEEADRIYEEVDRKLESRRKANSVLVKEDSIKEPSIGDQFADLKRSLSTVEAWQWESIPEVGDLTKRNKRARLLERLQQRFYAVPDSILGGGGNMMLTSAPIDAESATNIQSISQAKEKLLSQQLDSVLDNSGYSGTNSIDTDDNLVQPITDAEIDDIKRGRLILASLRKTEPLKPNSWIASARLEEQAKKFTTAKNLIIEGCHKIPRNEDIWLESIRIHQNSAEGTRMCKMICGEGLKYNRNSEKLWLKAKSLEHPLDILSQRKVLMKALEAIPNSVTIWKALIELEKDEEDAKKLLSKAVELCPKEWDFWVPLINLSPYTEAKLLINKARKEMNDNYKIWLTAVKLEERENVGISEAKLLKFMQKAVKELKKNTTDELKLLNRQQWLSEAAIAETEEFPHTCKSIVSVALDEDDVNSEQTLQKWLEEAEKYAQSSHTKTADYIYQYIISKFPQNMDGWLKLFQSLKSSKEFSQLFKYYERAIELNPENELYYLMYAKDLWKLEDDTQSARDILTRAHAKFPQNEQVWLARIKLEVQTGQVNSAAIISNDMIKNIPGESPRVWYKHIHLERYLSELKNFEVQRTIELCDEALELFPDCEKLHLQKGQVLLYDQKNPKLARESLSIGVRKCPHSTALWCLLAEVDEIHLKVQIRARATLDNAIVQNPTDASLWAYKIRFEKRQLDMASARQICNKALKQFPDSPDIWVENLYLLSKMSQRKNAFVDALKSTNNSPIILMNIGIFFWMDGKFLKAKTWLDRALQGNKHIGDCWGWCYNFALKHGTAQDKEKLVQDYMKWYEDINQGTVWNRETKKVQYYLSSPEMILEKVAEVLSLTSDNVSF